MKKIILIITCLIITGCANQKFYLDDEYYESSNLIEITNNELKELEKDKKSFIVFVNMPSCYAAISFGNIIDELLDDNQIIIYQVPFNEIEESDLNECIKFYPSLAIYHKGKIKAYLDADNKDDLEYYESALSLKKWLKEYIYLEK